MRYHVLRPAAGETIEDFLVHMIGLGPRSALKKAFAAGGVHRNGRAVLRGERVAEGDAIEILPSESWALFARDEMRVAAGRAEDARVVAESARLFVVDKVAGQACHPLKPTEQATTLNALAALDPATAAPLRPARPLEGALVHRLDRGTSGLLVCARTQTSFDALREVWSSRQIEKIYVAWLGGALEIDGRVELALAHDPKSSKRMTADAIRGARSWLAVTSMRSVRIYRSVSGESEATLMLIRIHSGVTHQIRVTTAHLGCPVIGDQVYRASRAALPTEPQSLDGATASAFDNLVPRLLKLDAPRFELCPPAGFLLHALWLRSSAIVELEQGLFAAPPAQFGGYQRY